MIPDYTMEGLRRYAENHVPTGGFLAAVLANDLIAAVGRADADNLAALPEIVVYICNHMPMDCYGSREAVEEWLKIRIVAQG